MANGQWMTDDASLIDHRPSTVAEKGVTSVRLTETVRCGG
jgi:hypothetical protein